MAINKQPIYPGRIKTPRVAVADSVAPRIITTQTPVTLYDGSSNEYGALVTRLHLVHLGVNALTTVRFYTKLMTANQYHLVLETATESSNATDTVANAPVIVELPPIHPNNGWPDNRGLRLEPGESLYVALGSTVAAGINVFAEVGEY